MVFSSEMFRGGAERSLLDVMHRNFITVRHVKPAASRQNPWKAMYWQQAFMVTVLQ